MFVCSNSDNKFCCYIATNTDIRALQETLMHLESLWFFLAQIVKRATPHDSKRVAHIVSNILLRSQRYLPTTTLSLINQNPLYYPKTCIHE